VHGRGSMVFDSCFYSERRECHTTQAFGVERSSPCGTHHWGMRRRFFRNWPTSASANFEFDRGYPNESVSGFWNDPTVQGDRDVFGQQYTGPDGDSDVEFFGIGVATINAAGLADAVAQGQSSIKATSGAVSGSTTLTVPAPTLVSISVTPANPSIPAGGTKQFKATGTYSDTSTQDLTAAATWSSSAMNVATINPAGLAAAVAQGQTTMKAASGAVNGSTTLTVTAPILVSITVTPANPSVIVGKTQQFKATGTYTDNSTQDLSGNTTWSSSVPSVASINTMGLATAVAQGQTTIISKSGSISGSTTLAVTTPVLVSIAINPGNPSIPIGLTQQFNATGTYSDNHTQDLTAATTWSSSALSVATVVSGGLASSAGQGQSTISASSGAISGSTTLTVVPGSFISTSSLLTGRYSHTATLLNNGRVLITGGSNASNSGGGALASAELYDPTIGAFTAAGNLTTPRYLHSATLLSNGLVLVVGGQYPSLASAELYNPTTGVFAATGSLSTTRGSHTATLLNNGLVLIAGGQDSGSNWLSSAELYNPATGAFTVTGSMSVPRANHTATLLNNGMVLISGGISSNVAQSSAELYNPATGAFTVTGNMSSSRTGHTATLLNNGQVLLSAGAYGPGAVQATAELYSPATGTFAPTGNLSTARGLHTSTLLNNGMALIVGGLGGTTLASAELYQPTAGVFTATGSLITARFHQTATRLNNGAVLIVGGTNLNYTVLNTAELYDAPVTASTLVSIAITPTNPSIPVGKTQQFKATGTYSDSSTQDLTPSATWSSSAPGVASVSSAGLAASLAQGQTTIGALSGSITGSTTLTVGTSNFVPTGSLNNARGQHTSTLLNNGTVLIVGGNVEGIPLDSAEGYSLATGTFTASASLFSARSNHTATRLMNGKVLIVGGLVNNGLTASTASAELYDPGTGTMTATGSLNTSRGYHTATLLLNGMVLVAGGETIGGGGATVLSSVELYDPATGTFTSTGSLNTSRSFHTATLLANGMVLIAAGYNNNSGASTSAELYNPVTGTFAVTGSLNTPRYEHTATSLNNGMVLVVGGVGCSGNACGNVVLSSAELFDPATGQFVGTGGLNTARAVHTETLLNNGMVLIAGGGNLSGPIAMGEIYDPAKGTFAIAGSLNSARTGHTATLLNSGSVLICGGVSSTYLASAELFF
jgi:hypothetical protein